MSDIVSNQENRFGLPDNINNNNNNNITFVVLLEMQIW